MDDKQYIQRDLFGEEEQKKGRRCTLAEDAFDDVTEEAAYWIGFLMADGSISISQQRQPALRLRLSLQDVFHLESFRAFLGSSHKISLASCGKYQHCSLQVRSRKLVDCLARFGVLPSKTFASEVVGLEGNRHFWRGVIDGDGCLHMGANAGQKKLPKLHLCGSLTLLKQFCAFGQTAVLGCSLQARRQSAVWQVNVAGQWAQKLVAVMYDECSVALPRKLLVAQTIKAWKPRDPVAWLLTSPAGETATCFNLAAFCRGARIGEKYFREKGRSHGWRCVRLGRMPNPSVI